MKIFLDCGYYVGKALEYYAPLMDKTWKVYAFEPNTELNVEKTSKRFPFEVEWVKKAVWIKDESVKFDTSSYDNASHIATSGKTVEAIDFSKFVVELPKDATIVVSMDIEGSEYPVLRKMLKDSTIKRLSLLDVEFHDRLLKDETPESTSQLRMAVEAEGVLVKLKL